MGAEQFRGPDLMGCGSVAQTKTGKGSSATTSRIVLRVFGRGVTGPGRVFGLSQHKRTEEGR